MSVEPPKSSLIRRVPRIIELWENNCDPTWTVLIRTAGPALTSAALMLVDIDMRGFMRGWILPKQKRGGGRILRGARARTVLTRTGRAVRSVAAFWGEGGQVSGRALHANRVAAGKQIGKAGHFLWELDQVTQRLLWFWLLVDVTTQFAYAWTSGIYTSEECSQSWDAAGKWTMTAPVAGCNDNPDITEMTEIIARNCDWVRGIRFFGAHYDGIAIVSCKVKGGRKTFFPQSQTLTIAKVDGISITPMFQFCADTEELNRNDEKTFGVACRFFRATSIKAFWSRECQNQAPDTYLEFDLQAFGNVST